MATIESRKNTDGKTSYRVKIRIRGVSETMTFSRKTDAKDWAEKRQTEIKEGQVFGGARKTLRQAIERYRQEELPRLAISEQRARSLKLAWWENRRGTELLTAIDRPTIHVDLLDLRRKGPQGRPLKFATANRYKAALGAVLSCAVEDWHWLSHHPLRGSGRRKRPKGEREEERERELTPEERVQLWEACRRSSDDRLFALVVCAYHSGAREGELMGLERQRLHLHPMFRDRETGTMRGGVPRAEIVDTKIGESRLLYFPGEAGEILRKLAETPRLSRYVFAGTSDAPGQVPVFPENAWRTARRRARLEDFRFHDLRHSWACNLVEEGATLTELMILGGWKSPIMVRRYAKRAHREGRASADLMERMGRR